MGVATNSMAHTVQRTRPNRGEDAWPSIWLSKTVASTSAEQLRVDMLFLPTCKRDPAPLPQPRLLPGDAPRPTSPERRNPFAAPYRGALEWRGIRECHR